MGRLSVVKCAFWGSLLLFALSHLFHLLRLFVTPLCNTQTPLCTTHIFDGFLLWFRIAYACPATASLCNKHVNRKPKWACHYEIVLVSLPLLRCNRKAEVEQELLRRIGAQEMKQGGHGVWKKLGIWKWPKRQRAHSRDRSNTTCSTLTSVQRLHNVRTFVDVLYPMQNLP